MASELMSRSRADEITQGFRYACESIEVSAHRWRHIAREIVEDGVLDVLGRDLESYLREYACVDVTVAHVRHGVRWAQIENLVSARLTMREADVLAKLPDDRIYSAYTEVRQLTGAGNGTGADLKHVVNRTLKAIGAPPVTSTQPGRGGTDAAPPKKDEEPKNEATTGSTATTTATVVVQPDGGTRGEAEGDADGVSTDAQTPSPQTPIADAPALTIVQKMTNLRLVSYEMADWLATRQTLKGPSDLLERFKAAVEAVR